ncbi:MAG TPA: GNAT family N-acetyltransferase, partial [Myxococcota bacterium]
PPHFVVANTPLSCAKLFVLRGIVLERGGVEPCFAFGGNGGFAGGTLTALGTGTLLELERPICPVGARVGVVLLQGAGLGPVRVLDVLALAPRPSTAADRAALFALHRAALREQVELAYGPWDDLDQRVRFDKAFVVGDASVYADDDGRVFASLRVEVRERELYIVQIVVHPDAQGTGVGTAIVRGVMAQARTAERDVTLRVLRGNERALALYQRLGFHVDGDNPTHWFMRRRAR